MNIFQYKEGLDELVHCYEEDKKVVDHDSEPEEVR